jgi:hypothetical protein
MFPSRLFPLSLAVLAVSALGVLVAAAPQERAKPSTPADFGTLLTKAKTSYDAGRFGACVKDLQSAVSLVAVQRAKAIRAALPAAPAGYKIVNDDSMEEALANPMLGAMALGIGSVIQQTYRAEERGASIDVTITVDSPMLQMFKMWITNPAMLPKGSELVKYGPHNAILQQEGGGKTRSLQLLIDANMMEVKWPSADEDALFAMFDQKAVDALAAVLGN